MYILESVQKGLFFPFVIPIHLLWWEWWISRGAKRWSLIKQRRRSKLWVHQPPFEPCSLEGDSREILRFECTRFWLGPRVPQNERSSWAVSQSRIRKVNKIWERARRQPAGDKSRRSKQTLELLAVVAALHPNLSFSLFHVHSTTNRPCRRNFTRTRKSFSLNGLCLKANALCAFVLEKVIFLVHTWSTAKMLS